MSDSEPPLVRVYAAVYESAMDLTMNGPRTHRMPEKTKREDAATQVRILGERNRSGNYLNLRVQTRLVTDWEDE